MIAYRDMKTAGALMNKMLRQYLRGGAVAYLLFCVRLLVCMAFSGNGNVSRCDWGVRVYVCPSNSLVSVSLNSVQKRRMSKKPLHVRNSSRLRSLISPFSWCQECCHLLHDVHFPSCQHLVVAASCGSERDVGQRLREKWEGEQPVEGVEHKLYGQAAQRSGMHLSEQCFFDVLHVFGRVQAAYRVCQVVRVALYLPYHEKGQQRLPAHHAEICVHDVGYALYHGLVMVDDVADCRYE